MHKLVFYIDIFNIMNLPSVSIVVLLMVQFSFSLINMATPLCFEQAKNMRGNCGKVNVGSVAFDIWVQRTELATRPRNSEQNVSIRLHIFTIHLCLIDTKRIQDL